MAEFGASWIPTHKILWIGKWLNLNKSPWPVWTSTHHHVTWKNLERVEIKQEEKGRRKGPAMTVSESNYIRAILLQEASNLLNFLTLTLDASINTPLTLNRTLWVMQLADDSTVNKTRGLMAAAGTLSYPMESWPSWPWGPMFTNIHVLDHLN